MSVLAHLQRLKSFRQPWLHQWQEISDLILPTKSGFTRKPQRGQPYPVLNSLPHWALEQFAAGLHAALTGGDRPWFTLRFLRPNNNPQTQEWLDEVSERLFALLNAPRSGFFSSSFDTWLELGAFGTAVVYAQEGDPPLQFFHRPLFECFLEEGPDENIDTVIRQFQMSPETIRQTWPAAQDHPALQRHLLQDREIDVVHCVRPTADGRWESVYVCGDTMVDRVEMDDFPYLIARWIRGNGETYARSPAMTALPDIKMLYRLEEAVLQAAQLLINPPLIVTDGFQVPFRFAPGVLIPTKPGHTIHPLYPTQHLNVGQTEIAVKKQDILRAFYIDLFRLEGSTAMTATEVLHRREERLRLLGPVIGRLQREFLSSLIERAYRVAWRQGLLPPPPPWVERLEIEYISPLAQAQRQLDLQRLEALLALGGRAESVSGLESGEVLRYAVETLGLPPRLLKSVRQSVEEEAVERRQEEEREAYEEFERGSKAVSSGAKALESLRRVLG